jgi:site-specific DNA-methyltransferase (adenine-specific)
MSTQAGFALRGRNPDVLTCIANLSNDEVFTPPEFANRMLTRWRGVGFNGGANPGRTKRWFLDPCTKSGDLRGSPPLVRLGRESDLEARGPHPHEAGVRHRHHDLTSLLARRASTAPSTPEA